MAFPPPSPQAPGRSLLHPPDLHLHLCKLRRALSCSICHRLLQKPACLQCNHHFCMTCLLQSMEEMSACPKCKQPAATRQARFAPEMENLVEIYQSLETVVGLGSCFPDITTSNTANDDPQIEKYMDTTFNVKVEDDCLSPSALKRQRRYDSRERVSSISTDATEADTRKRDASSIEVPCRGILPAPKRIQLPCPPLPGDNHEVANRERSHLTSSTHDTASMELYGNEPIDPQDTIFAHATIGGHTRETGSVLCSHENKVYVPINPCVSEPLHQVQLSSCASPLKKKINQDPEVSAQGILTKDDAPSLEIPSSFCNQGPNIEPVHAQGHPGNQNIQHDAELPNQAEQDSEQVTCEFCHKPDNSQVAGPMIHYKRGVPVSGSKKSGKTLSVHKNCAEWAPGVYFEDDVAKNIPQEVARGHKIKCYVCGLRGAVLGCYVKRCRKSFHFPCAHTLSCRWDDSNFLVFCPEHVNSRFPDEGAKVNTLKPAHELESEGNVRQESLVNEYRPHVTVTGVETLTQPVKMEASVQEPSGQWAPSKFVLCGSGLSPKANELVASFVSYTGLRFEKTWTSSVTHLIAGTDDVGAARRTFKYLVANLEGRWIVKVDWLSACMAAGQFVSEEPYEVNLDVHGMIGGPRRARGMVIAKVHRLFEGLRFYFLGEYISAYRADLQALLISAGGVVLLKMPDALDRDVKVGMVIIYCKDMHLADMSVCHREELNRKNYTEARLFAAAVGAKVAGHTWILDSVAAYELQPYE